MQGSEIAACVLLPLFFAIASVGGVGGGIIFIPLAIGLLHFSTKDAIAVASAIITVSALLRFVFFSSHASHPERPSATEIDYTLVKLVYPTFIVGSYFGVIFSVSLGELPLAVLLICILFYLTFNVFTQGIKRYKKETIDMSAVGEPLLAASEAPPGGNGKNSQNDKQTNDESSLLVDESTAEKDSGELAKLEEILNREKTTCS